MKLTIKVTLMSALVYPGVGHFVLKNYLTCTLFVSLTTYLMVSSINDIFSKLNIIKIGIDNGAVAKNFPAIRQALLEQGIFDNPALENNVTILFTLWLVAAVDAYRIARTKEKSNS
jgi:hypothetical protein